MTTHIRIKSFINFSALPPFRIRRLSLERAERKEETNMRHVTEQTWEYLVRDFLDIKCTLKEPEQEFLLDFLKGKGLKADEIRMHPAFSVDDHLVVIMKDERSKKRVFYHPQKRTIEE